MEAIKQAWYRYDVLLFRSQRLSDDDLLGFSRNFGTLDAPPNQGADPHNDQDVDSGDQDRQPTVDERLVDDDVDVVEAVPEHGDPDGNRQRRGGERQQHRDL